MNILFISAKKGLNELYQTAFFANLYNYLKARHKVDIVTENSAILAAIGKRKSIKLKNVKWTIWDLILIQDNETLIKVKNRIEQTDVPVVFFSHTSQFASSPIMFKNLLKVIMLSNARPAGFIYYEILKNIERPLFLKESAMIKKKQVPSAHVNLLFIQNESNLNHSTLQSIILFANINFSSSRLRMFVRDKYIDLCKSLVNENTSVQSISAFSEGHLINCDLAFTSGDSCWITSRYAIPTFVTGERGFGGLLTRQNLDEHVTHNFQGRIGGEIGEEIPHWIIEEELLAFKNLYEETMEEARLFAEMIEERCSPLKIFPEVEADFVSLIQLKRQIDSAKCLSLLPTLSKGVRMVPSDDKSEVYLMNAIGFVLGVISPAEKEIMDLCGGDRNVRLIAKLTKTSGNDLKKFMKELWYNKIVQMIIPARH